LQWAACTLERALCTLQWALCLPKWAPGVRNAHRRLKWIAQVDRRPRDLGAGAAKVERRTLAALAGPVGPIIFCNGNIFHTQQRKYVYCAPTGSKKAAKERQESGLEESGRLLSAKWAVLRPATPPSAAAATRFEVGRPADKARLERAPCPAAWRGRPLFVQRARHCAVCRRAPL